MQNSMYSGLIDLETCIAAAIASISSRMKHYEQLRFLHKLYDDGILNDEFGEQKLKILEVLKSP